MTFTAALTPVKNLVHLEETPVVEIFKHGEDWLANLSDDDWLNSLADDNEVGEQINDVEGAGLIIYVYQGNRAWFRTSVSKTPFAYLKKSLVNLDQAYLKQIFLVRGTSDYPLTEKEIKTLSGMLFERFKDTSVATFTSYTTVYDETDETKTILNNALADVVDLFVATGLDVEKRVAPPVEQGEFGTGTETFKVNGVELTVNTHLADDSDPSKGLGFVSVKVVTEAGEQLLYVSSGVTP